MPTYKNNNEYDVAVQDKRIPAGYEITSLEFYSTLPSGVVMTSVLPSWNPIIFQTTESGNIAETDVVNVPAQADGQDLTRYSLDVFCVIGKVEVRFNTANMSPPIILDANEGYQTTVLSRVVDSIRLTYLQNGTTVEVQIDK